MNTQNTNVVLGREDKLLNTLELRLNHRKEIRISTNFQLIFIDLKNPMGYEIIYRDSLGILYYD